MAKRILILGLFLLQFAFYSQTKTEDRQITEIKADSDGRIEWAAIGETSKSPYIIEQFRWNKWIKIGEVDAAATHGKNSYSFGAIPHNGENLCRVKPLNNSDYSKEVKWISKASKIKFSLDQKTKTIQFSDETGPIETLYEIIDASGTLVKKGWGQNVSYENLPKGTYVLNYDNVTGEFKR